MKEKLLRVRADEQLMAKVEYIRRINSYKNCSDAVRKIIEKEYRKETLKNNE